MSNAGLEWIDLARADRPECGGKARGLARLIAAGLRVPAGVVIVGARSAGDLDSLDAIARLGSGKLAVRSSARGEDGEQASYAGQYLSVLEVEGEPALREAVDRCFASVHAERVRAYEGGSGEGEMAVVVQRMIDARCAGVLFTLDPVTGARDRWSIEAVEGLGEALVSGHARPDRHRVDPEHPELAVVSELAGDAPVLRDDELRRLVEQAKQALVRLGGSPLDMEWAIDREGEIHWLQARPATGLAGPGLGELDSTTKPPSLGFTRYNVGEILPGAITPLTATTTIELIEQGLQRFYRRLGIFVEGAEGADAPDRCLVMVSGHVFMNMRAPYLFSAKVAGADKQSADRSLGGRVFDELEGMPPWGPMRRLWTALRLFPVLRRADREVARVERELAALRASGDPIADLERLLHFGSDVAEVHMLASTWSGMLAGILENMLGEGKPLDAVQRQRFAGLLRGIGSIESADIGLELDAVVDALRSEPGACERLREADDAELLAWLRSREGGRASQCFGALLDRHGHRCVRELELREASWAEDPTPLLGVLRAATTGTTTRARPAAGNLDEVELPRKGARGIRWIVPKAHEAIRLRERCKSLFVQVVRRIKTHCVELGERLVGERALADLDMVFFLTRDELLASVRPGSTAARELTRIAARRRRALAQQASLRFAMVSRAKPQPLPPEPVPAGTRRLAGTPVSPGIVEGRARVVRTAREAGRLVPGEILIAPFTDAGWTPYFSVAAGLATEIGGTLSHGAVVARELGLPAVVDLGGATELFTTGQHVRLDADTGQLSALD
jgi:phosphohistidine swiveling domain-containing protein